MPQAAAAYAASAAATAAGATAGQAAFAAFVVSAIVGAGMQSNAQAKAKRKLLDELRSRNITIKSGMAPRTIALGTVRTSGPMMFAEFVGPNEDYLDSIVAINAGELSEFLGIYIGDEYIPVGAFSGDIPTSGKYAYDATVERQTREDSFTVTAATSVTLTFPPDGGVVLYAVLSTGSGESLNQDPLPGVSVSGSVVSWTGAVTGTVVVGYRSIAAALAPLRVQWVAGAASQATTTWSGISSPRWTSNHRLRGVAYVRTLKLVDHPLFLAGDSGDVGAVVRGPKGVWDPRTSTTLSYTSNPALLAAWYRTLPVADGGMGVPSGWIDWSTVSAAANVCDELISVRKLDGSGYENVKRYECHTRLSLDRTPADNLDIILSSMAGVFPFTGGYYKCFAGAFRSAVMTLTDDDVAVDDPITYTPEVAESSTPPNMATANFVDAARNWVKQPARPVVNSTYVTADGSEEPFEMELEATTDERQANYLMGVRLEQSRPSGRLTLTATGKAANLALMDTIQVNLQGYSSIAGKTFEVRRRTNQWSGRYPLELREVRSGTYALDADRFTAAAPVTPPDNSALFDVDPVPVTGLAEDLLYQADGTVISRAKMTWMLHPQANVSTIRLRWRRAGGDWIYGSPVAGDSLWAYTGPLGKNSVTLVEAQAVNNVGATSPWSGYSTTPTVPVVGKVAAPSNVASLAAAVDVDKVRISYAPCADSDYEATELRYGSTWSAGTLIWRGAGSAPPPWIPPSTGSYTVRAKHFDRSGNASATESTASVSFSAPAPGYIVNPGPIVLHIAGTATPTTCVAGLSFKTTGAIARKASGTSSTYNDVSNWAVGGTPPVTYYVRFMQRTLSGGTLGGTGSSWLALTVDRKVTLTATAGVLADAEVDYQVASDNAGATVVSSGTLELHAEST
jgi:hypothetical protein